MASKLLTSSPARVLARRCEGHARQLALQQQRWLTVQPTSMRVVADRAAAMAAFTSPKKVQNGDAASLPEHDVIEAAESFRRDGMVVLQNRVDPSWLQAAAAIAKSNFDDVRSVAGHCGESLDVGVANGFAEVVQRAKGRYDILWGINGDPVLQSSTALWEPLIQRLLGGREDMWKLQFNGLLMTLPGADEQGWHADGEHLFFERSGLHQLPPHCINVFVPLVPLSKANGGTDFCLGSHTLTDRTDDIVWQDQAWKEKIGFEGETLSLHLEPGQVALFDYRVLHRGHAHRGTEPRPVLYWTYTRRWFSDNLNFPTRSLKAKVAGVDAKARPQFPALSGPEVFADGAAGSQVPESVANAVSRHMLQSNANIGGDYRTGKAALEVVSTARRSAAALLGCKEPEVVFGLNCTNLVMHLSRSVARTLRPGDKVLLSSACHDSNFAPWLLAARDAGADVERIPVDEEGRLQLKEGQIDQRTKVVAVGLASNALGTLQQLEGVVAKAREVGALSVLDGTHYVAHRRFSLEASGADVLVCSPYKFCGPHMGLMVARAQVLQRLEPYKVGWRPPPAKDVLPYELPSQESYQISKWEMGTLPLEQLAGFSAAVQYFASLSSSDDTDLKRRLDQSFASIQAHETILSSHFLQGLQPLISRGKVKLVGPKSPAVRTPTFALLDPGRPEGLAKQLNQKGIFCTHGNHSAPALLEESLHLLDGVTRISFMHYNSLADVDRVLAALESVLSESA